MLHDMGTTAVCAALRKKTLPRNKWQETVMFMRGSTTIFWQKKRTAFVHCWNARRMELSIGYRSGAVLCDLRSTSLRMPSYAETKKRAHKTCQPKEEYAKCTWKSLHATLICTIWHYFANLNLSRFLLYWLLLQLLSCCRNYPERVLSMSLRSKLWTINRAEIFILEQNSLRIC